MATGYEDIENLTNKQSQMLDNSLNQQRNIINQQTEMNIADIQRSKEDVDKDVQKTNKALYSEYQKASNPYGANAENLASRGLGNSGYAESTQTNLYNTFQKNITDTMTNARDLKANFDNEITKARQTGNMQIAQSALEIYKQKMQLLSQEYELKNNREQFLYQKSIDDRNYKYQKSVDNRNYKYQKSVDNRNYKYQKKQDKQSQKNWRDEFNEGKRQFDLNYALSKKASASSGRRSSSRSTSRRSYRRSGGSSGGLVINTSDNNTQQKSSFTRNMLNDNNENFKKVVQNMKNTVKNGSEQGKANAQASLDKTLQQVQSDYDKGLITKDEYNKAMYLFDYR